MIDLEKICINLDKELSSCDNKENILLSCVTDKLSSLYMSQSDNLDKILSELNTYLDTDNVEYVYKVMKRLSKNLAGNRLQLIKLLEEVTK